MTDHLFPPGPGFAGLPKEQQTADHRKRFKRLDSFLRRHRARADEEEQRLSRFSAAFIPVNFRRHELPAVRAELQLRAAQLTVEVEVRDAYERYQSSAQRLNVFRGGLLRDADRVLEARLYAYQRGGATLLEVIDAQRKSADVYLAYSQSLMDHAHALVTLEEAAATWDVSF